MQSSFNSLSLNFPKITLLNDLDIGFKGLRSVEMCYPFALKVDIIHVLFSINVVIKYHTACFNE